MAGNVERQDTTFTVPAFIAFSPTDPFRTRELNRPQVDVPLRAIPANEKLLHSPAVIAIDSKGKIRL